MWSATIVSLMKALERIQSQLWLLTIFAYLAFKCPWNVSQGQKWDNMLSPPSPKHTNSIFPTHDVHLGILHVGKLDNLVTEDVITIHLVETIRFYCVTQYWARLQWHCSLPRCSCLPPVLLLSHTPLSHCEILSSIMIQAMNQFLLSDC